MMFFMQHPSDKRTEGRIVICHFQKKLKELGHSLPFRFAFPFSFFLKHFIKKKTGEASG
jgi:hypothetical protein